jgi:hypothetical protein
MGAMGVRRYSLDPTVRRQQELVDHLQQLCRVDYYAPTIGELIAARVLTVELQCRDYECLHTSAPIDLTRYPPKMRTKALRLKFVCSRCGRKRPQVNLQWHGEP